MEIKKYPYKKRPFIVKYKEPYLYNSKEKAFKTLEEAEEFVLKMQTRLEDEKSIISNAQKIKRIAVRKSLTVEGALCRYLDTLQSQSSRATREYHIKLFIGIFGKEKVVNLSKADAAAFIEIETKRGVSKNTIHTRLSIVRAAFNWCVNFGLIDASPFRGMKIAKAHPQVPAPPSVQEANVMYNAACDHVKRVIVLGMMTGARVGPTELFKIQWTDVDFINKIIRVPNANKGAKSDYRDVPMRLDLYQHMLQWHLEDAAKGQKHIIAFKGKPVRTISCGWLNAKRRAGILRRIRPYDLRHAFATLLLDNYGDIKSCMEIMGHTSENMILKYYQHTTSQQRRNAVNALPFLVNHLTQQELSPCPTPQPCICLTLEPESSPAHGPLRLLEERNSQYPQAPLLSPYHPQPPPGMFGYGTATNGPSLKTIDSTWTTREQSRAGLSIGCLEIPTLPRPGIWRRLVHSLRTLCSKLRRLRPRRPMNLKISSLPPLRPV